MMQAFIIVLREGIEAFLIVAITFTYLRKVNQKKLIQAVWWGIAGSLAGSAGLGYFLWWSQGVNEPMIEAIFGFVTVILVGSLVVHMWKVGPQLKQEMEHRLSEVTALPSGKASFWGVFLFTLFMISREGMETALLLFQVHDPKIVTGVFLGLLGAGIVAFLWQQFGYLIKLKHFFQVTAVYLLLFIVQIAIQSFHELTETNLLPMRDQLHEATESWSHDGFYGKWFSILTLAGCGLWLMGAWVTDQFLTRSNAAEGEI